MGRAEEDGQGHVGVCVQFFGTDSSLPKSLSSLY